MRRLFLPILIAALWLASLAGAGWMRARCVAECSRVAAAQVADAHARPCCAKHAAKQASKGCNPADCPKCKALDKAQVWAQAADAPVFFAADLGAPVPVPVGASRPLAVLPRAWAWSLPPPDTLLKLRCQLLI